MGHDDSHFAVRPVRVPLSPGFSISHANGVAQNGNAKGGARPANGEGVIARHHVVLPRFIVHDPVGAGQVVKRVTSAVGVRPCAGCQQRAARLDRWLRIEPQR